MICISMYIYSNMYLRNVVLKVNIYIKTGNPCTLIYLTKDHIINHYNIIQLYLKFISL